MKPLRLAILGCGARGRIYSRIAVSLGDRYKITAATDPVEARRAAVADLGPPLSNRHKLVAWTGHGCHG